MFRKRRFERFFAWLVHRRFSTHLALLAVILTLPALWTGWQLDDLFHRVVLLKPEAYGAEPCDVFSTAGGTPEETAHHIDLGSLPWWTPPGFDITFLRHLSVLTMMLDYELWPESPALMHLHSLLWYAALAVAACCLYRRLIGFTWAAGLAALMYAIDDAHAAPAAWLANRNAVLAAFFGILCLAAHDRWLRDGWKPGAWLSPACMALALLSGETALAAAGYLFAYAIFLHRDVWQRRLLALVPTGLVIASWGAIYVGFEYGAHGSGFYVDPLAAPALFLEILLERAPLLLMGQWTLIPADISVLAPALPAGLFAILGGATIAALLFLFHPIIRSDRTARFFGLGMLLSLLPIAAAPAGNRLLLFVGLGAMGLLARFLSGWIDGAEWRPTSRIWRWPACLLIVLLIFVHLVAAPLAMPFGAYAFKLVGDPIVEAVESLPDEPEIAAQDFIFVNPPDVIFCTGLLSATRIIEGEPLPRRTRVLCQGPVPLKISRMDENTLKVVMRGGLFTGMLGRLFRGKDFPMRKGETIRLTGMTVRVLHLDENGNGPDELLYTFDRPLEDPSLRWFEWKENAYVPFAPPRPGETVELPVSLDPLNLFGE